MAKLTKLTSEQEALLPLVRDEWINLALGGDTSLDRAALHDSIAWMYGLAGHQRPLLLVLDSPLGCQLAANFVSRLVKDPAQVSAQVSDQVSGQVLAQVWGQVSGQVRGQVLAQVSAQVSDQVRDQVLAQVSGQVLAQVRGQVSAQVRGQVLAQVSAQVSDQVRDQVSDQVSGQVRGQVLAQVSAQVSDQVSDQVRDQVSGQVRDQKIEYYSFASIGLGYDAGWTSFYEAFQRLGIIKHEAFGGQWLQFMRLGVWDCILLRGCAIVSRRPKMVKRDDQNRLHCTTGPAIEWGDGYTGYYLHGMRIQSAWVESPESITVAQVLGQDNVELRRAMVTLMGMDRFVREANATVLEEDRDLAGMPRRLLHIPFGDDEPIVLVEVQCPSTGKIAHLRVPPDMRKCHDAVAWTFGLEPDKYRPLVEA